MKRRRKIVAVIRSMKTNKKPRGMIEHVKADELLPPKSEDEKWLEELDREIEDEEVS